MARRFARLLALLAALSSFSANAAHAWDAWDGSTLAENCKNWPTGGKQDFQNAFKDRRLHWLCLGRDWRTRWLGILHFGGRQAEPNKWT